jgi:hypothetical protein
MSLNLPDKLKDHPIEFQIQVIEESIRIANRKKTFAKFYIYMCWIFGLLNTFFAIKGLSDMDWMAILNLCGMYLFATFIEEAKNKIKDLDVILEDIDQYRKTIQ